jgi:cell division protein FtsI/penicillin-binding protein 2
LTAATPARTTKTRPGAANARKKAAPNRRASGNGYWTAPTFNPEATASDFLDGEDLTVRRAAAEALGQYNGAVVVTDAATGRILTIVNQKLAFQAGFTPCSTIKLYAALAGLSEGLVERHTLLRLSRYQRMNLTEALATSNNPYFAWIGERLGFEKILEYAREYGLGEKAGLAIPEEQASTLPPHPPQPLGMMTSFGQNFLVTPLQLAAFTGAIANGGTLYYLQYPRSQAEAAALVPRVKRRLEIENLIPEIRPGMMGAVEFGTARRAAYNANEPIYGKTGTCTDFRMPTHLGWFASFNDTGRNKLVVVVLLTGGKPINGPVASEVAGAVYRSLSKQNYFQQARTLSPAALTALQAAGY